MQSFDYRTLKAARLREPKLSLAALVENRPKESLLALARSYDAQIVLPNYEWLNAGDVKELKAGGVKVIPWTANSAVAPEARALVIV